MQRSCGLRPDVGFIIPIVLTALLVYGLWHLGFSFTKFINGIANLGNFVVLMFPPSWGDQQSLLRYLHALGETVAIAFLGTMLAAIIAFPLGFIAARNTTVSRSCGSFRAAALIRCVAPTCWSGR